ELSENFLSNSSSDNIFVIAILNSSTFLHKIPLTPFLTASLFPITSVATIGFPNDIASKIVNGRPSQRDVCMYILKVFVIFKTCLLFNQPVILILREVSFVFNSPSPIHTNLMSGKDKAIWLNNSGFF